MIREGREMLDRVFENELQIVSLLSPGRWLRSAKVGEAFHRINREGGHYQREDVSVSFPEFQQFAYDTGAAMSRVYGDHPAFDSALLSTEVRGESQVSFHPAEIKAAEEAIGGSIPDAVTIKNGVQYEKLPDFPEDRVIADNEGANENPSRQVIEHLSKITTCIYIVKHKVKNEIPNPSTNRKVTKRPAQGWPLVGATFSSHC